MTVTVLCLFFMVPWIGLQYVIVVFPDHTCIHFIFTYLPFWTKLVVFSM